MKVNGLDGRQYTINFSQYQSNPTAQNKSQYHLKARELIASLYPCNPAYEEVLLPGCRFTLYADFFLPTLGVVIEVHGEQHYTDNSFFYKTKADFFRAKQRDAVKLAWCEANNIQYIELSYKDTEDGWRDKLR